MKRSFVRTITVIVSILLPAVAFAGPFAVGSGGSVPNLSPTPNLANGYSGHHPVGEIRGWLYPTGMKTPPNSKETFGLFGTTRYALVLSPDSSAERETRPLGVDEDESLRSDFEFQRTMSHKLLRLVADPGEVSRLERELLSADKPIALEGQLSDSASPILTVSKIAEPKAYDATSSAIHSTNPVASRSSEIKTN
jgi:hypothetical protein